MSDIDRIENNIIRLNEDYSERIRKRQAIKDRSNSLSKIIQHLLTTGQISYDEFEKWALDETGEYLPKLKTEE